MLMKNSSDTKSAHEGGNFVSRTHRPLLPLRKYFWHLFVLKAESTQRL